MRVLLINHARHTRQRFHDLIRTTDPVSQPVSQVLAGDAQRRSVFHQSDIVDIRHFRATYADVDPAHNHQTLLYRTQNDATELVYSTLHAGTTGWLPQPQTEEQTFTSQPWYHVSANDVFPEQFRLFFSGHQQARDAFEQLHSDLYDPAWWIALQEGLRAGYVADVFPYRKKQRFQQQPVSLTQPPDR